MTGDSGAAVIPNLSFVAMTRKQLDDLPSVFNDPEFEYLSETVKVTWRTDNMTRRDDLAAFDRREKIKYAFLRRLVVAMAEAGVPLLAGTDASSPGLFPGASLHLEMEELVKAGLTERQALNAATAVPGEFAAEHFSARLPFGVIEKGARADIVILEDDPLNDISHTRSIAGVVANGRWSSRETLEAARRSAASRK